MIWVLQTDDYDSSYIFQGVTDIKEVAELWEKNGGFAEETTINEFPIDMRTTIGKQIQEILDRNK